MYTLSTVDSKKRRFLVQTGSLLGAIGAAGVAVPLLRSMSPNRSVQSDGAPITVDISTIAEGEQKTVIWRGKPVWIIRRTQEALASLSLTEKSLSDPGSKIGQQPEYAQNIHRSLKPEILVLIGICTHLGCAPTYRPDKGGIDSDWQGGFFCSCHGSKFDLAGRVFKGVPAPTNLEVPPYHFVSDNKIIIGESATI